MSHPRVAVFARLANGNAAPVRIIDGQGAKLARALHGLAYDEVHDEIIAPNPFAEAILFFRGGTNGEEGPIRVIQGPHTQLDGGPDWNTPDVVAYDPVYDEVYTRLRRGKGAILVFPRAGNGDVAPLRVLRGVATKNSNDRVQECSSTVRAGPWEQGLTGAQPDSPGPKCRVSGSATVLNPHQYRVRTDGINQRAGSQAVRLSYRWCRPPS